MPLTEKDVANIVQIQFNELKKTLLESEINIDISVAAIDWMVKAGYDPHYGARPIKRILQKHLVNELSKQLIAGTINKTDKILVDSFDEEGLVFRKA